MAGWEKNLTSLQTGINDRPFGGGGLLNQSLLVYISHNLSTKRHELLTDGYDSFTC